MYALSESILELTGNYRVETYRLTLNDFEEEVRIELNIFGEGEYETYIGEYYVMQDESEEISGACLNRKTKEEILLAVEEAVITELIKKHRKKGLSK